MGTRLQAVARLELKRLDGEKKSLRRDLAFIAEKERCIQVLLKGDGDSAPCSSERVIGSGSTRGRKRSTTKCMGILPAILSVIEDSKDEPLTTASIAERLMSRGWKLLRRRDIRARSPRAIVSGLLSQYVRTGYVVIVTRRDKRSGGHTWALTEHGRWRLTKADKMVVKSKFMGDLKKETDTADQLPGKHAAVD